ncbi:MAG: hypothetical protein ACOYM9_08055 [Bradymonadia bacterium]
MTARWVPLVALLGCAPSLDDADTLVSAPRVLAVKAEPAEVVPGSTTTLSALVVGPMGRLDDAPLRWQVCLNRKPLVESGVVATTCLEALDPEDTPPEPAPDAGPSDSPTSAVGTEVALTVPQEACRVFGPDPPLVEVPSSQPEGPAPDPEGTSEPVEPARPGRPVDPDFTGGFQQPVVLRGEPLGLETAVYGVRITCANPGATRAQATQLGRFGHANGQPALDALEYQDPRGAWRAFGETPAEVGPGDVLTLRARWPKCPAEGRDACGDKVCGPREDVAGCPGDCAPLLGCGGAERYLLLDPTTGEVTEREERLRVSWWSTGGRFGAPRTGPESDRAESQDTFEAPDASGLYTLWVVLRDERGGVDWRQVEVLVR